MTAKKWIIIVLLCVGITACDPPPKTTDLHAADTGHIQVWIDAPLPNSTIPMLPYKLVFHGASYDGISEFELRINSAYFATVLPSSNGSGGGNNGTLFYGETLWTPPAPGTYLIEVIAKGNGQVSSPDQVYVTVIGDDDDVITPSPTPRLTPLPNPTATSRATQAPTATSRATQAPTSTNTPIPEDGQIKVHLFMDANSNGNQDRSEVDYPNVQVSLKSCSCRDSCRESHNATTDTYGNVLFSNLHYGPYCVTTDTRLTPTNTYPVNVNVNSPSIVVVTIGYK